MQIANLSDNEVTGCRFMLFFTVILRTTGSLWRLALVLAAINQVFSLLDPLIFRHIIDSTPLVSRSIRAPSFAGRSVLLAAAGRRCLCLASRQKFSRTITSMSLLSR